MKVSLRRINLRDSGVIIGFIILCVVVSFLSPAFLSAGNIMNLLRQYSVIGLLSVGMTYVIISANFDISVGYLCGFCSAMMAMLMTNLGLGVLPALLITMVAGCVMGLVNGIAVGTLGIPSMVATLGTGEILNGMTLMVTGGYPISVSGNFMDIMGRGTLLGFPIPVIIFILSILAAQFGLKRTKFGRSVYAIGGNMEASRLSGIKVNKTVIEVFVLMGLLSAIAGVLLLARAQTATATGGMGYELEAIAAVVIGGTRVSGGEGSAYKTIIGVLFLGVISNAFNLMGVSIYFQYIFKGLIILIAVGFDSYSRIIAERK